MVRHTRPPGLNSGVKSLVPHACTQDLTPDLSPGGRDSAFLLKSTQSEQHIDTAKMKVNFRKSVNILTCSNNFFQLNLNVKVIKINEKNSILYDTEDIIQFVNNFFIPPLKFGTRQDCERFSKLFIYLGCSQTIDDKKYVTVTGLKHFFSSFVSLMAIENQLAYFDRNHSKFINWFLQFDLDSTVFKAVNLADPVRHCTFCKQIVIDQDDQTNFSETNSELIANWRHECIKAGEPLEDTDDQINFLVQLAKVAGHELKRIIIHDNKVFQSKSQKTKLVNYDPCKDWQSSSPIVRIFIEEILAEYPSDLFKVTFRNTIFLGNHKRKYPLKPQSCYFTSCIIKYLQDKQKILDFLSSIGIGVGDDAINSLEKNQINEFNSKFWAIPSTATVMAVMDNNQADFGTKTYNPLKDEHHVDGLNVLQVIKPTGNSDLDKQGKPISELNSTFIDETQPEKKKVIILYSALILCCLNLLIFNQKMI